MGGIVTSDMVSWLREQIRLRKALAELASGEAWAARRVMGVGYMVAEEDGHAVARLWVEMGDLVDGMQPVGVNPLDTSKHIAFNDPRQIVADCETQLALIELHDDLHDCVTPTSSQVFPAGDRDEIPCPVIQGLAYGYRNRLGYLPEWAPEGTTP